VVVNIELERSYLKNVLSGDKPWSGAIVSKDVLSETSHGVELERSYLKDVLSGDKPWSGAIVSKNVLSGDKPWSETSHGVVS
jgi:hypothetical protein